MVFTLRPAAHLRALATGVGLGRITRSSNVARFVQGMSFIVGAKVRDVRWWFALAKLWPDTETFLDWDKIIAIANGDRES